MTYTWDAEKRMYRDENGKLVPVGDVRSWVDDSLALLALLFISRANKAIEDPSFEHLQAWNLETREQLRLIHYLMVTIAFGGIEQMNVETWDEAERRIQTELSYFDSFAFGVFFGSIALDGNFANRTSQYALAGYATFEHATMIRERNAGMNQYKNILGPADHCTACLSETAKDWVVIGGLTPIGSRQCLRRCRCHYIYRLQP